MLHQTSRTADDMSEPTIIQTALTRDPCEVAAVEFAKAGAHTKKDPFEPFQVAPACKEIVQKTRKIRAPISYLNHPPLACFLERRFLLSLRSL